MSDQDRVGRCCRFPENIWIALAVTLAAGLATAIGSLLLLFSRRPSPRLLAFGLAFAGGAMVYVSLSEILNKSIASFAQAYGERTGFTYGTLAFLLGVIVIVLTDHFIPNPHESLDKQDPAFRENSREYLKRVALLTSIAITAHNFPEGLATFFATLESPSVGMPWPSPSPSTTFPRASRSRCRCISPPRTRPMRSPPACCRAWPSRSAQRSATCCCPDRCRTPRSAGCSA